MKRISFLIPDGLYSELQEAAAFVEEHGYDAQRRANDLISSELAAQRLPKVTALRQHSTAQSKYSVQDVHGVRGFDGTRIQRLSFGTAP